MKIGYLIGSIQRGGAEKQLVELSIGMVRKGHEVEIASYDGPGYYDSILEENGVVVKVMNSKNKIEKIRNINMWIKKFKPDIVHGIMKRASSIAILQKLFNKNLVVVASDYSTATYSKHKPIFWLSYILFHFSDCVVTETNVNAKNLITYSPFMKKKIFVIRNGVNLDRFHKRNHTNRNKKIKFLTVGTVYKVKNPVNLVKAVNILRNKSYDNFELDWFGAKGQNSLNTNDYLISKYLIAEYNIDDRFMFHDPVEEIDKIYKKADYLVHVSIQDGIPNAIVEGMACGLPILVSNVSDLPELVELGKNGFVCDPKRPESIAAGMEKLILLDDTSYESMSRNSRNIAEKYFGVDRFVDEHDRMYRCIMDIEK